jgi:cytochrome c oxidase subunit II
VHFASVLSPTNIFAPVSTPANSIFGLSLFVLAVAAVIFTVVFSLLLFSVVRFRKRRDDDGREPPQIYGSNQVELAWTVIPTLIVVTLFMATARVIAGIQKPPRPASALEVVAVGHQFWWEFRYPALKIVTANELHVPLSDPEHPTPTFLTLTSADTDHSFWVPRLAGKTDLIPNRVNTMWIDPHETGFTWASVRSIAVRSMPRCCCASMSRLEMTSNDGFKNRINRPTPMTLYSRGRGSSRPPLASTVTP